GARRPEARHEHYRAGADGLLPGTDGPLQVPDLDRDPERAVADRDRQAPEVQAPRAVLEGARAPRELRAHGRAATPPPEGRGAPATSRRPVSFPGRPIRR